MFDTVAVSEFAKPVANPGLKQWLASVPDEARRVSILTLGEIDAGVHGLPRGKRRELLEAWAAGLTEQYAGRLLGFDLDTVRIWGRKQAVLRSKGVTVPTVDVMLAATAIQHGLDVVTRNGKHFDWCGVTVVNPWT
ncbi:MAG: type II toxin-antitoxin system VapC family toxin [Alphaproteobacteria bacterium]|nr:type II toxin-antitoxin system VapC family toxin [Alphaproteobacteria bacterium]